MKGVPDMAIVQVKISFAQPAADQLAQIRQRMIESKGRHVTYTEVLEELMKRAGEREDAGT